jgi:hypothetical protein
MDNPLYYYDLILPNSPPSLYKELKNQIYPKSLSSKHDAQPNGPNSEWFYWESPSDPKSTPRVTLRFDKRLNGNCDLTIAVSFPTDRPYW